MLEKEREGPQTAFGSGGAWAEGVTGEGEGSLLDSSVEALSVYGHGGAREQGGTMEQDHFKALQGLS